MLVHDLPIAKRSDIFWSFIRIFYCSVEKGKFVTVFIALYWVCLKVWLWVDREQA
jgi:hypothetical protein